MTAERYVVVAGSRATNADDFTGIPASEIEDPRPILLVGRGVDSGPQLDTDHRVGGNKAIGKIDVRGGVRTATRKIDLAAGGIGALALDDAVGSPDGVGDLRALRRTAGRIVKTVAIHRSPGEPRRRCRGRSTVIADFLTVIVRDLSPAEGIAVNPNLPDGA